VLIIFRRDPQRHKKSLVSVQKEIGVQNVLQTIQKKSPVKNREICKNQYSQKLNRSKSFGKLSKET
jgi:hypothetical protein